MTPAMSRWAAVALATMLVAGCAKETAPEGEAVVPVKQGPASTLPDGDPVAGEKLANVAMGANNQSCIQCHGPHGNKPNADDRPRIGGQYPDYISHALQSYRAGDRNNATMVGQAKDLTDKQIEDLAAYFGSQEGTLTDLSTINE